MDQAPNFSIPTHVSTIFLVDSGVAGPGFRFLNFVNEFLEFVPGQISVPGIPGVLCPTCDAQGVESWVIRGKVCSKCGTPCQ
ncbi:hypothetical protein L873DRAFT_1733084 [Choiromyces venosus 120613-1]|uniref:Uncharacterized protein n=1 Tax=Choiromyces venosus 120613-1 TaxID=1336337 RepID=A0A3N4JYH1_9PEZI|nr:hypothetical protein L873DRAFT_1733084 [Choiromyces venosus 120613-1]